LKLCFGSFFSDVFFDHYFSVVSFVLAISGSKIIKVVIKMEFFTFFTVVLLFAFWYHTKYYRRNGLLHKIPAIRSFPFVGSNLSFIGKTPAQLFVTLQKAFEEHGPLFRFDLTPFHSAIVVADPKIAEGLLSSQKLIEKSVEYDLIRSWLGDGCFELILPSSA
jgi:hypothetical protein